MFAADEEDAAAASRSAALRAFSASFLAFASAFLAPFLEVVSSILCVDAFVVGRQWEVLWRGGGVRESLGGKCANFGIFGLSEGQPCLPREDISRG